MSQVISQIPSSFALLRYADDITLGSQERGGSCKTLSFKDEESIEKRIQKFTLFSEEHFSTWRSTAKNLTDKDYKLRGFDELGKPKSLESRLYSTALACMKEMATDYERRIKVTPETLHLMNAGVFYGNTYLQLLLDLKNKPLSEKDRKAMEKILEIYTKDGSFYHGRAPSKYFKLQEDNTSPTGKKCTTYLLKDKSVSASVALDAVLSKKELTFLDCGTACQIAFHQELREILEKDKYNSVFGFDGPNPFMLSILTKSDPLLCLIKDIAFSPEACVEGAWIFIRGPLIYGAKHLNGEGQNWNALIGGSKNEKFFGLGLKPEGETLEDIERTFLKEFNADPVGMKGITAQVAAKIEKTYSKAMLSQAKRLKNHRITLKELREYGGAKRIFIRHLDWVKVQKLVDSKPDEARLLMAKWKEDVMKINMGVPGRQRHV